MNLTVKTARSALKKAQAAIQLLRAEREQDMLEIAFLRAELKKLQEGRE